MAARRRAQRHAHADFGGTLADHGGEHAIESDAGENRCHGGEHGDQQQLEARRRLRVRNDLFRALQFVDHQAAIVFGQGGTHGGGVLRGIAGDAQSPARDGAMAQEGIGEVDLLAAGIGQRRGVHMRRLRPRFPPTRVRAC